MIKCIPSTSFILWSGCFSIWSGWWSYGLCSCHEYHISNIWQGVSWKNGIWPNSLAPCVLLVLIILLSHVSNSCSLQQNQVQQSMTLMYFTWIKFNASFFARRNDNVLEALPWFRIITKETSMCGTTPTFLHQNEIEAHHQFCHSIFLQVARWIG